MTHTLWTRSPVSLYNTRDFQILKLFSVNILDLSSYAKFARGGGVWCWLCKITGCQARGKWPESFGTRVKDVWARAREDNPGIVVFLELTSLLVSWFLCSGRYPRSPCAGYSRYKGSLYQVVSKIHYNSIIVHTINQHQCGYSSLIQCSAVITLKCYDN